MSKPSLIAYFKQGMSLGACQYFKETFNWVSSWVANLQAGQGILFEGQNSDHPTIKCNIQAGSGISITESNGALKISLSDSGDDDDDSGGGGSSYRRGSGGNGGTGGNRGGTGSNSGGNSSGGNGFDGEDGKGYSGGGSSFGGGTSCNKWSDDLNNDNSDSGMGNSGDNCSTLNGW